MTYFDGWNGAGAGIAQKRVAKEFHECEAGWFHEHSGQVIQLSTDEVRHRSEPVGPMVRNQLVVVHSDRVRELRQQMTDTQTAMRK
jgi:hypothetical protein